MYKPVLILVIDDIETNLFMLSTLLKREGFNVMTASSGPEGRRLALERKPDLILLDIVMPEENGFLTCEYLKKDSATAAIPILFLSALEDTDSKIKGLAMGAADFITKPFMKEEILVRIRAHVRLRRDQALFVESLGLLLAGGGPDCSTDGASIAKEVSIADGISGFFSARSSASSDGRLAANALGLLLPRIATPLLSLEEAVVLLNYVLRKAYPSISPVFAAYCVFNRNASRFSVILSGQAHAILADTKESAYYCGKRGDALCALDVPFIQRVDLPAKPGFRVCVMLCEIDREEHLEAVRLRFRAGTSLPIEEQRADMAAALDELLPSSHSDRVFVFEAT